MVYVSEEEDIDTAGVYASLTEIVAILRYEAALAEQNLGDERADDCLNAIADTFAQEAVNAARQFEEGEG